MSIVLTSPTRKCEAEWRLPYAADKRKLYKVGISFSSETGTINDFDYE